MSRAATGVSLRAKMLWIVVGGAIVPLALVGFWLATGIRQSGEAILVSRLDSTLIRETRVIGETWVRHRSALLSIAEDSLVREVLRRGASPTPYALPQLTRAIAELRDATTRIELHGTGGGKWVLSTDSGQAPRMIPVADTTESEGAGDGVLPVHFPVDQRDGDGHTGSIEALIKVTALTSSLAARSAVSGSAVAVVDRTTGATIVSLPFAPAQMRERHFAWGGEEWLAATRVMDEPAIELLAAVPSTAFTAPFESAARRGVLAMALVALTGLAITLVLTRHVTSSLVALATAADAVTKGDLQQRVVARGGDEVGRVARAFNDMTDSLRRMLLERSEREAVSAVGEFAASLAHEIRNPLSAVRLNLQHLQGQLAPDDAANVSVAAGLADIERLDRTVAGVLRMARSGQLPMDPIDLRTPIEAAMRDVLPLCGQRGVRIMPFVAGALPARGNAAALEQLFLNLLLNAAQATPRGEAIGVEAESRDDTWVVTVWDQGAGFTDDAREQAFSPFFSTKAEGTGLGLTLATRIAAAHAGSIAIDGAPGRASRLSVTIPRRVPDEPASDARNAPSVAL